VLAIGAHGVQCRPVSIPESVLEQYATGPATSSDMRSIVAAKINNEIRNDRFFDALMRAKEGA
jgi:hypothetical protein